MNSRRYLLVINHVVKNVVRAVDELRNTSEFRDLDILVITDKPDFNYKYSKYVNHNQVIQCDFQDQNDIASKLKPYMNNIVGVICRGDRHIQYLRKVAPLLPKSVLVATPDSLERATNKHLMRQSFTNKYPEISPKAVRVKFDSEASLEELENSIGYPMIIKPANLFSSLLIQVCMNRHDLKNALENVFGKIQELYNQRDIHENPQVIAEEYLEGDFYSIDAYVMKQGDIYFCPPVAYIPAKAIGIDDFFLYKRYIPSGLRKSQIINANETTKKALDSIGLSNSSAHVELVLTKKGWKIIEIGPRLGRFRHLMYELGYGIDHSLNDIKIHLGQKPKIPSKLINYCAAYSIYATKEGRLKKLQGMEVLERLSEVKNIKIHSQPGDEVKFAKHGGHAIAEFLITSADEKKYNDASLIVEEQVWAEVD